MEADVQLRVTEADAQPRVTVAGAQPRVTEADVQRRAATAEDRPMVVDRTAEDRRTAVAEADMGGNTALDSFPA